MRQPLATRPAIRPAGPARVVFWLAPRWRDPGWIAFVLNRLTGHILILYLLAHLVVLSRLLAGPGAWDELQAIFGSRPFLVGDTLLVAAAVFHALNGLRVAALTANLGVDHVGRSIALVIVASAGLSGLAAWGILAR